MYTNDELTISVNSSLHWHKELERVTRGMLQRAPKERLTPHQLVLDLQIQYYLHDMFPNLEEANISCRLVQEKDKMLEKRKAEPEYLTTRDMRSFLQLDFLLNTTAHELYEHHERFRTGKNPTEWLLCYEWRAL